MAVTPCAVCAATFDGRTDYYDQPLRGGTRRLYCSRRCRQDARNRLRAARGYKQRPTAVDDVAVERAINGDHTVMAHLNRKERAEVFRVLYARGLSAAQISRRTGVTGRTAERHRPPRVTTPPPAGKEPAMPAPVTGWSVNRLTARAVVLHAKDPVEARELLECLGLIVPGGRSILPDDTRNYDVEGTAPDSGSTIGWRKVAPEPRADRRFVPDGLAS